MKKQKKQRPTRVKESSVKRKSCDNIQSLERKYIDKAPEYKIKRKNYSYIRE